MNETKTEWRDCADPEELAAAVAAGVEVRWAKPGWSSGEWALSTSSSPANFAGAMRRGNRYSVPALWSWRPEPVCRHCHGAGYIDTSAGTVACDCVEPPAPDDLVSRARRHADTHPESMDLIEELLAGYEPCVSNPCESCRGRTARSTPPAGCEAVWLETGVVDHFATLAPPSDPGPATSLITACREARARRGTTAVDPERPTTPVPPWPGAVLSGLTDEDGAPTWLAQAGDVHGERVRACTSVPWLPNTSYGEDEWVEVRAPRAVPVPETERVPWWEAKDRLGLAGDRFVEVGADDEGPWVRVVEGGTKLHSPVEPDGTVKVLKDGDR